MYSGSVSIGSVVVSGVSEVTVGSEAAPPQEVRISADRIRENRRCFFIW